MSKTNPTKQQTNPKENTMSNRTNLQAVYNFVVGNWATDKAEIAAAKIVPAAELPGILKTLVKSNLIVADHVNGERTLTYQSHFDIENELNVLERSAGAFNEAFPEQVEPVKAERTHNTGPRYTDEQLAQAKALRESGLSWPKVAAELGIKAPYRLKMRVERDLGTPVAQVAGNDPLVDTYVELLEAALAEKRTSGPLKARIREALGK